MYFVTFISECLSSQYRIVPHTVFCLFLCFVAKTILNHDGNVWKNLLTGIPDVMAVLPSCHHCQYIDWQFDARQTLLASVIYLPHTVAKSPHHLWTPHMWCVKISSANDYNSFILNQGLVYNFKAAMLNTPGMRARFFCGRRILCNWAKGIVSKLFRFRELMTLPQTP